MSLNRLIFYCAMIGGWAAFAGWFLSETLLFRRSFHEGFWGFMVILLAAGLVGGCIAGGLTLLGGLASGTLRGQAHRFLPGFLGGAIGGIAGSLPGNSLYLVFEFKLFQLIGWTMVGLAIGAVEGIYDKSPKKLRNGLIGGGIGGFLGGLLFILLGATSMAERAAGFVILGVCIGCFIGLAQVMLKEAWLTVEAGFRPGRQLVLSLPEIIMGTSEKASLPFIAFGAKGVEPIHVRIKRRQDGSYLLEDNHTRTGTFVNGAQVQGDVVLRNDDLIQLGVNVVRFREVLKHVPDGDENRRAGAAPATPVARPAASPIPAVVAVSLPPVRSAAPMAAPVARPNPPIPPRVAPRPGPSAAVSPVPKAPPPAPANAPRPPARPALPTPAVPNSPIVAAAPSGVPGCPVCGRAGVVVPQSGKRRCVSCGILY
ncbi:MAG TPA: FHA domain-containing protein [Gemmataceae bacterium]|nr:FHA domain-containing protein [Gemmataceae bacterium]